MNELSSDFLEELAKACVINGEILSVVKPHFNYSFISNKNGPYKEIFKYIFDHHSATNKAPTIGLIAQSITTKEALPIIGRIRDVNVFNTKEAIIDKFEEFVKRGRFMILHKKIEEIFNSGQQDKAYKVMEVESAEINAFSLKRQMHSKIFANYDDRQKARQDKEHIVNVKVPTGIPQFDYHTRGGIDRGTGLLGIGRSGAGKTTFLRSLGANAAFRGINVLHFAAGDSTQDEVETGYDAWWTGMNLNDLREGKFTGVDMKKVAKAKEAWLGQCGEIIPYVFKQFNSASISDCRNILIELLKEYDIGLVLFDYLEKFEPGDGKRYGTNQEGNSARKLATAEKIINIATEFNVAVATVTQASDIAKEMWDNANWVLTRNNIANLKATIDPFAYCITLNATQDENDAEIMRIHEEKLRHYKIYSYTSTYHIAQKRDVGRFIDVQETNKRFWDAENKKIIKYIHKVKDEVNKKAA
jgi:replicative DNA helicase